ncbi:MULTISPECIES: inositol monophosphatase family protein [Streptomyces]|uniref:inositol monophosphatase family protein n=1 Tax=Streptomyces TaxID=1883 RepID=UPI003A4C816D
MTDALRDELLDVALEAARRAGALLVEGRPADLGVAATKTSPVDVVTEMDVAAETLISGFLADRRPEDGLLGEEGGSTAGTSGVRWVVDPIDGTVNYLYQRADWAVSVAAELHGVAVVGVVAAPARGEVHHAALGQGARLDGRPVRCRPSPPLDQALIATGFNYVADVRAEQAALVRALLPRVRDIRRSGSAALDLCDVACGRADGYYERGTNPWDRAAGALIAREAGAVTGGRTPGSHPDEELSLAASPGLFPVLRETLVSLGA